MAVCSTCGGKGKVVCPECNGTGKAVDPWGKVMDCVKEVTCMTCGGSKKSR